MRSKTPALVTAVSALLRSNRPDDELFVVDFNDRVSFARPGGRPFTNGAKELATSLTAVDAEGKTALYDAVAEGLHHLRNGHAEKHALIVLSEGGDNASRRTYAEVLALARRSDVVIYAIGLLRTSPAEEEEDAGLIKRLCQDTGGAAYFPRSAEDTVAASTHIARDLREQYTLGLGPVRTLMHAPSERLRSGSPRQVRAGSTSGRCQVTSLTETRTRETRSVLLAPLFARLATYRERQRS